MIFWHTLPSAHTPSNNYILNIRLSIRPWALAELCRISSSSNYPIRHHRQVLRSTAALNQSNYPHQTPQALLYFVTSFKLHYICIYPKFRSGKFYAALQPSINHSEQPRSSLASAYCPLAAPRRSPQPSSNVQIAVLPPSTNEPALLLGSSSVPAIPHHHASKASEPQSSSSPRQQLTTLVAPSHLHITITAIVSYPGPTVDS